MFSHDRFGHKKKTNTKAIYGVLAILDMPNN